MGRLAPSLIAAGVVPMTDKPRKRTRASYAEEQERLAAEAVDRWVVIVADRPPLSEAQIRGLAVILNRIEARQAQERASKPDPAS